MNNNTIATKIRIARCSVVQEDRLHAVIHLNEFDHLVGQIVMVRYYKDGPNTENRSIDTITAIGIKDDRGKDCYSIISEGGKYYVGGIYEELPDVSDLVHDIPYVAKVNDKWCIVFIGDDDRTRTIRELQDGDIIYNLEDGHLYYYRDGELFRDDSQAELMGDMLQLLALNGLNLTVSPVGGETPGLCKKGTLLSPVRLRLQVITGSGEDLTDSCSYTITLNGNRIYPNGDITNGVAILEGIENTTTYIVTAEYTIGKHSIISAPVSITFLFVDPILYGAQGSQYTEKLWDGTGECELTFNLNNKKSIIKVPTEYAPLSHIRDIHGLDYLYDDYTKSTEGIYTVYTKKDAVKINNFKQILYR